MCLRTGRDRSSGLYASCLLRLSDSLIVKGAILAEMAEDNANARAQAKFRARIKEQEQANTKTIEEQAKCIEEQAKCIEDLKYRLRVADARAESLKSQPEREESRCRIADSNDEGARVNPHNTAYTEIESEPLTSKQIDALGDDLMTSANLSLPPSVFWNESPYTDPISDPISVYDPPSIDFDSDTIAVSALSNSSGIGEIMPDIHMPRVDNASNSFLPMQNHSDYGFGNTATPWTSFGASAPYAEPLISSMDVMALQTPPFSTTAQSSMMDVIQSILPRPQNVTEMDVEYAREKRLTIQSFERIACSSSAY